MNPNREGCHYLEVKKLSALLRGITSKHHSDFYCVNCLQSFVKEDFCSIIMPSEDTQISKLSQKSDKAPFVVYADLECLIEKINGCKNNPENAVTTNLSQRIPSVFSIIAISSQKTNMMYTEVKIAWKTFVNPQDSMLQR